MYMCVIYCIYYYIEVDNKLFFLKMTLPTLNPSTVVPILLTQLKKKYLSSYLIDSLF